MKYTVLALFSIALSTTMAAASTSSTAYAIDPAAQIELAKMQSAYSSLHSLSEHITASESPDLPASISVHTYLRILRPGYVSMVCDSKSARSGSSLVVTDGSHCYVTAPQYPTRYLKFPVPEAPEAFSAALDEGITSSLTLQLFSDPSTVSALFSEKRLATLQKAKPVKIDGVPTDVIVATDVNGVTLTLFIDQSDHLLRRVIAVDPNKAGNFTETYISIAANSPLSASDFSFAAPPHTEPFYGSSFRQAIQDAPN